VQDVKSVSYRPEFCKEVHLVEKKRDPYYFVHNFDKFACVVVIFSGHRV